MADTQENKEQGVKTLEIRKKFSMKGWSTNDWFTFIAVICSCISLAGLFLTWSQINQDREFNEKQFALDAIKETKNERFIRAVGRFETIANYKEKMEMTKILDVLYGEAPQTNKNLMLHDLNFILNKYNYISLLYFNKLAARDIIKTAIYADIEQLHHILDRLPDLARKLDRSGVEELWKSFNESD